MKFLVVVLALIGASSSMGEPRDQARVTETTTLFGTVRPLADVLREHGISSDVEALAGQLVLVLTKGEAIPLLQNPESRALFTDQKLRNRPTEIVGRRIEGLPYLDVVLFRVQDEHGDLRIAEYYCDVCSISVRYDQICPCCGAAMAFRYKPAD